MNPPKLTPYALDLIAAVEARDGMFKEPPNPKPVHVPKEVHKKLTEPYPGARRHPDFDSIQRREHGINL